MTREANDVSTELGMHNINIFPASSRNVARLNNYQPYLSPHISPPLITLKSIEKVQPCWINLPSSHPNTGDSATLVFTAFTVTRKNDLCPALLGW